jgi:hypothetical protein
MDKEPITKVENLDTKKDLHRALGEALEDNNSQEALSLILELQQTLEMEISQVEVHEETSDQFSEILSTEEVVENIYNLIGTEFTIFGTERGLKVSLSATMGNERRLVGQNKDINGYERGRSKESIKAGLKLSKIGGRKAVELVQHSRDAFNREGFKGIQIIFPLDDEGVADTAAEDNANLHAAVLQIWTGLAEHISSTERQYFTPKQS